MPNLISASAFPADFRSLVHLDYNRIAAETKHQAFSLGLQVHNNAVVIL
jgi:hypothetical protein